MRILTVISGVLIAACGIFCFLFNSAAFASVAFLVGMVMAVSGACSTVAYMISGRGLNRLTETSLVEGLVTMLYGFAVLNNQVTDGMLTMFFGTWLTLCGVTRFSQSLYVSRFNPKDWAKILPLGAVTGMLGVVMMMPSLVTGVNPLMLVGGSFICDGLSMLMFAMFMKRRTEASGEAEMKAKERMLARKAANAEKRKERDRLRSLSLQEREEEQQKKMKENAEAEAAIKKAKAEAKAAKKEASRPASEKTLEFTPAETAIIEAAAQKTEEEIATEVKESLRPVWQRPTEIPSVRANLSRDTVNDLNADQVEITPIKFTAVNLEEIESAKPVVEFEKVKMPEFKLASDEISADRDSVLKEIDDTTIEHEDVDYTPIDLNELVAEPMARPYDPKEATRFTQTLNFKLIEEIENAAKKNE